MVRAGAARNPRCMRREDRQALREIRAAMEATGKPLDMTDRELRAAVMDVAGHRVDALQLVAWMLRYPPGPRPPFVPAYDGAGCAPACAEN